MSKPRAICRSGRARAIVTMAQAEPPPLRLPLGADAFTANRHKLAHVTAEMAAWQALGESTAFAPEPR